MPGKRISATDTANADDVSVHGPLLDHLSGFNALPFLFVGAGLSRRYLGLDDWESLLRRFAAETSRSYEYYVASSGGLYPEIGQLLAEEFHQIWWSDPRYIDSRNQFKERARNRQSALKIEVSQYVINSGHGWPSDGDLCRELNILKDAVIDGVITTDYDELMEKVFPDFPVFVGQDDLIFRDAQGIGDIYKIHGSVVDPDSLVLTKDDYTRFENRSNYLAAKLLTIFVENPVVFLGYSLSDVNIQTILHSVARCLTPSNVSKLEDRLIFVEWSPQASDLESRRTVDKHTIMLEGAPIPARRIRAKSFLPIFESLKRLHRTYSTDALRYLKNDVVRLVRSSDPEKRIQVVDFDKNSDLEKVKVVIGVGSFSEITSKVTSIGYRGVDRFALMRDILHNDQNFDPELVVRNTLPFVARGNAFVPCFKYLKKSNVLSGGKSFADVLPGYAAKLHEMPRNLAPNVQYQNKLDREGWDTIEDLLDHADEQFLLYLTGLPATELPIEKLRQILIDHEGLLANTTLKTAFAKAVCLLDYLENHEMDTE